MLEWGGFLRLRFVVLHDAAELQLDAVLSRLSPLPDADLRERVCQDAQSLLIPDLSP